MPLSAKQESTGDAAQPTFAKQTKHRRWETRLLSLAGPLCFLTGARTPDRKLRALAAPMPGAVAPAGQAPVAATQQRQIRPARPFCAASRRSHASAALSSTVHLRGALLWPVCCDRALMFGPHGSVRQLHSWCGTAGNLAGMRSVLGSHWQIKGLTHFAHAGVEAHETGFRSFKFGLCSCRWQAFARI